MKNKKLYFKYKDDKYCYTLDIIKDEMKLEGITELTICEAVKEKIEGVFYCKEFGEWGEIGDDCVPCGKQCEEYSPCNGKSGKCRHWSNISYTPAEKTIKIIINPKGEVK